MRASLAVIPLLLLLICAILYLSTHYIIASFIGLIGLGALLLSACASTIDLQ
ncbi:MAG: hypothetical protein JWP94_3744 [Mucilaginibacter sp.]|nr:hypothetical protein [Mucilaginibacter sp.]